MPKELFDTVCKKFGLNVHHGHHSRRGDRNIHIWDTHRDEGFAIILPDGHEETSLGFVEFTIRDSDFLVFICTVTNGRILFEGPETPTCKDHNCPHEKMRQSDNPATTVKEFAMKFDRNSRSVKVNGYSIILPTIQSWQNLLSQLKRADYFYINQSKVADVWVDDTTMQCHALVTDVAAEEAWSDQLEQNHSTGLSREVMFQHICAFLREAGFQEGKEYFISSATGSLCVTINFENRFDIRINQYNPLVASITEIGRKYYVDDLSFEEIRTRLGYKDNVFIAVKLKEIYEHIELAVNILDPSRNFMTVTIQNPRNCDGRFHPFSKVYNCLRITSGSPADRILGAKRSKYYTCYDLKCHTEKFKIVLLEELNTVGLHLHI